MKKKWARRLMSIGLSFSLVFTTVMSASAFTEADQEAKLENEKVIVFHDEDYEGLSVLEIGKEKLLSGGFTQSYIETISEDVIEQIASASSAVQSVTYYEENQQDGRSTLNQISEYKYLEKEAFIKEEILQKLADQIEVIDENGNVVYSPEEKIHTYEADGTIESDGGVVVFDNVVYNIADSVPSACLMVSQFIWTTMPKYRGLDFFGLTRDSNTVEVPNCFHNFTQYRQQDYIFLAGNYGVTHTKAGDPILHTTTDPGNDAGDDVNAYVMNMSVPGDILPPAQMIQGSTFRAKVFYGFEGGMQYGQALKQPSVKPQNFNIWVSYLHQTGYKFGLTAPSIMIPLRGGISINTYWESVYDQVVDATFLLTWG